MDKPFTLDVAQQGMLRFRYLVKQFTLPPRGPKGSKQNERRALYFNAIAHQSMVKTKSDVWQAKHKKQRCKYCKVKLVEGRQ